MLTCLEYWNFCGFSEEYLESQASRPLRVFEKMAEESQGLYRYLVRLSHAFAQSSGVDQRIDQLINVVGAPPYGVSALGPGFVAIPFSSYIFQNKASPDNLCCHYGGPV